MSDTIETADLTAVEEQLDAWIEGALTELGHQPENHEEADRLLWALRGVRRRRAEAQAVVRARKDQLDTWLRQQTDQHDAAERRLVDLLQGWTHAQAEQTGRQTFRLPAGTLQVRKRLVRAVVIGDAKGPITVAGVRGLVPDAVKTTHEVLPGQVKSVARPDTQDITPWAIQQGVDVPDGYSARQALVGEGDGTQRVPGVLLLVPVEGRPGRTFEAKT